MKPLDDETFKKAEPVFTVLTFLAGVVVFGLIVVVAIWSAPSVEQLFKWTDGR